MALEYSPIVLDSIDHKSFPEVELFVKLDAKYTLYKPEKTKLTIHNIERLRENGTEFVYINSKDAEDVQEHVEKRLEDSRALNILSQYSKNLICSQMIIKCIDNVFKNPNQTAAFKKCCNVLGKVSFNFADRNELVKLFSKLEDNFDKYLIKHSAQTTILALFMCDKLFNAGKDELINVGAGAMLHDIGMLSVTSEITDKDDALSEDEYYRVKLHPKYGVGLLNNAGVTSRIVLDITLSHHERQDGSGYPGGVVGNAIPKHAMLVSICDIYCALTMNRPYKTASTPADALKTLKSEKRLFDPAILEGFLGIMEDSSLPETAVEEKKSTVVVKTLDMAEIRELRNQMRNPKADRNKLIKMHSIITDNINNTFGEERAALTELRTELKNLLKSLFPEGAAKM
ncbi:MAG: HD domain-containing phosphohydrolase [Oryzomonas sp.]|uniref:HD-GYP domain-containing protein n=1 Tax=Oryzomonas sp. TaxID=2855186 RepID=UPI00283FFD9C|nr:HD domain-containing phosphohydrolase [Oryzomonas sp.]MDR3581165.1 HD domain-containing phosphohydrolase [Oryzomonas sp.]